jgi:creatinine amidohydrolase
VTRIALQSWPQVESYLARSRFVIVPIGSTEQHGPNGLIGTDFICAEAIAAGVGETIDALVAPTINVGMALHHMAFPGTISYRPETLIAIIGDYVRSLHAHGFRGVLFLNGHGGNIATGAAAMSGLREVLPEMKLWWTNWWEATGVVARGRELFGEREGGHATPSEVSVTMAVHPGAVTPIEGPLDIESCRSRGIAGSARFREMYPDGRMGSDPSLARQEHGEELLGLAVAGLADRAREYAAQVAPAAPAR